MTVLITGANRGIGHELYTLYQSQGASVIGTARSGSDHLPLEVTDPTSHAALAAHLDGKPIDLLVCNAGVYFDTAESLDTGYPADMWAQTFAVNVTGVFLTVQSLLPNLRLAKAPKIAIISSQMASHTRAPGGSYIYRASKAAALNLGRNLATDLRSVGIAVGIYHPGWVQTDMGGAAADINVSESAQGLAAQFEALSMDTTGKFLTWDGREHPF
ncbi:SDR family NAD(P)-dependent oxidoreductase [Donghicola sp. XS_ASV15]|uniref:SDR family NAD(P)-dependent oxidoreductase n=1 Tax=Donghicola sp. XS_ASV15 TaxID=3241295 RepID=UPI00351734AE